jgi:hypothetical protein
MSGLAPAVSVADVVCLDGRVSKRAEGSKGDATVAGIGAVVIAKVENGLCIALEFVATH